MRSGAHCATTLAKWNRCSLKGDYKAAAVRYEAIVKMLPTFYEAYFDLGMRYGQLDTD